jgi:hypothetical protein
MANKTYTVVKDGKIIKELKTLAAAKKLADTEGGEVLCEGECVYQGTPDTVLAPEQESVKPEPAKYTLLRKMNVRRLHPLRQTG